MTRVLMICLICIFPTWLSANPSLVVIGADGEEGTIASSDPIYARVTSAIVQKLNNWNFTTYSEAGLPEAMHSTSTRDYATVVDFSRTIQSQRVDMLVLFSVHLYYEDTIAGGQKSVRLRATGEIFDITTGQAWDSFETKSSDYWRIKNDCTNKCLSERVGEYATWLADELGEVLAQKLDYILGMPDFSYKYQINYASIDERYQTRLRADLKQLNGYAGYSNYPLGIYFHSKLSQAQVSEQLRGVVAAWQEQAKIESSGRAFTLHIRGEQQATSEKDVESILFN